LEERWGNPRWVKLYSLGIQFRILFLSIKEIDEERVPIGGQGR
jgi:hypothetical protein